MRTLVATLALLGVLAAGCPTSSSSSVRTPPAPEPTATVRPVATPRPIATPRISATTPEAIEYAPKDPAFEALPGARAIWGEYDGGTYRIELPNAWNGDVVYYAHGYRGHAIELEVSFPALREHLIAAGFAWAASSYTQNGYEPGVGARDTYLLRDIFEREAGPPARSYLFGESMGGHVVALLLEQYPATYSGALTTCGAVSGHGILDYFVSWTLLASYFSELDLWALAADGDTFRSAVNDVVLPRLGAADALTEDGRAFADVVQRLTGGPRAFFWEGFQQAYATNFAILADAAQHPGAANAAGENVDVAYAIGAGYGTGAAELNERISRVAVAPLYRDRARYPEFADLTGEIRAPFITLHNTGDLFVPISVEQAYRRTVEAAGNGDLLVQRAIRRAGHCVITPREVSRGFDDLVAWVETGRRPAGDDLLGDLTNVGLAFTTPLEPSDPGGLTLDDPRSQ